MELCVHTHALANIELLICLRSKEYYEKWLKAQEMNLKHAA